MYGLRNYCTMTDMNYLDCTQALQASLLKHCRPYHLWILALCPDSLAHLKRLDLPHTTIIPLSAVETECLTQTRDRQHQEFIWTVKPSWILWLLQNIPNVYSLIYLDSDVYFFDWPMGIFAEVGNADVAITPHRFMPDIHDWGIGNGIFNAGFVYIRQTPTGIACIREWANQCIDWCSLDRQDDGRFVDQGYLNAWPQVWGAHIIQHKGVNLAPWNQDQYQYSISGGRMYVDNVPIICYHFHKKLHIGFHTHGFVKQNLYTEYQIALEEAYERISYDHYNWYNKD